ncbi:MAG: ABC transporter substrate-binding protein [Pseudonocardiaceae bacterium]
MRVTDGNELLADNLADVENLIRAENDRVTDSGAEWVGIAVMQTIRPAPGERDTLPRVMHSLRGAYLAQFWSNHQNGDVRQFRSDRPLIKLFVADTGTRGEEWPDTVAQLVTMSEPGNSAHLVAVAGLSRSTAATQAAVDELARHNIPMVGSTITATNLTAPGLVRVAATNSDEATATIEYLKTTPAWQRASIEKPFRAYLLQDRAAADTYATDLGTKYRQAFPPGATTHILASGQGDFDGQRPGVGSTLANQIPTICAINPDVVFFAGRSNDLQTFLGHLAARQCNNEPITVVSASDVSVLNNPRRTEPLWTASGENITVLYTALASPQTWQKKYQEYVPPATLVRFGQCSMCYQALFPHDPLDDGYAIMAHDSVFTAVTAARNTSSQQDPQPTADALFNGLYQINVTKKVPGASGWIYFQRESDRPDGVPYNKAVPIMQLHPDGTATLVALSSRSGTPPTGNESPR